MKKIQKNQIQARAWVSVYGPPAETILRESAVLGQSVAKTMQAAVEGREPSLGLSAELLSLVRWKVRRAEIGMSVADVVTELLTAWLRGQIKLDREP